MSDFEDWCQQRGGEVIDTGEDLVCRTGMESRVEFVDEHESNIPFLGLFLIIAGLGISTTLKMWVVSNTLRGSTGPIMEDVAVATLVPFASVLVVDLPMWAMYLIAWSWLGVIMGFMLMVFALTSKMHDMVAYAAGFYLGLVVSNTVVSGIFAGALSLISETGFSMQIFSELYLLTRIGILSVPGVIMSPDTVFDFSQILWLGIVVFWFITTFWMFRSGDT